jgi:hypothetical protein
MDSQEVIACQVWFLTAVTGVGPSGRFAVENRSHDIFKLYLFINMEVGRNFFFDQTG